MKRVAEKYLVPSNRAVVEIVPATTASQAAERTATRQGTCASQGSCLATHRRPQVCQQRSCPMNRLLPRSVLVSSVALVVACGSRSPEPATPTPVASAPSESSDTSPGSARRPARGRDHSEPAPSPTLVHRTLPNGLALPHRAAEELPGRQAQARRFWAVRSSDGRNKSSGRRR